MFSSYVNQPFPCSQALTSHMRLLLHKDIFLTFLSCQPCSRPPSSLHCEDSFLTLLGSQHPTLEPSAPHGCPFHTVGLWYSVLGSPPKWGAYSPLPVQSLTLYQAPLRAPCFPHPAWSWSSFGADLPWAHPPHPALRSLLHRGLAHLAYAAQAPALCQTVLLCKSHTNPYVCPSLSSEHLPHLS